MRYLYLGLIYTFIGCSSSLAKTKYLVKADVGGALLFSACPSVCLSVHPSVCPSVRLSVVTLTQSFLIGFLPNFIYGLLLSTSRSSSNTGFVRHTITKMADKIAATRINIRCRGNSKASISLGCEQFTTISRLI